MRKFDAYLACVCLLGLLFTVLMGFIVFAGG
jgi:hypothetical protein